jgi:hypothetical protein
MYCAERRRDEDGGTIRLLIDPARVRRVMSERRYSLEQCWKLLKELRGCTIEIDTPKMRSLGGIIESAEYTKTETRPDPLTGEQRRLWTVRLGKAWAEIMKLDMTTNGDPSAIAGLEHGISKALARFMLTHSTHRQPNGGWVLDTVIHAVSGEIGTDGLKNARRHLRAEAHALRTLGVEIHGDRVRLVSQQPDEVSHPPDAVSHPPDEVSQPPGGVTAAHVPLGSFRPF